MMDAAKALDAAQGLAIDYVVGKAEATGLPCGDFDLVTGGLLLALVRPPKASAEVLRLLKPGGWLLICAQNWFPLRDNVVARTEAIVQRIIPNGRSTGWMA